MMIFLEHPKHGRKVAYLQAEAEADKANGWTEYDPEKEKSNVVRKEEGKKTTEEVVDEIDTIKRELDKRKIPYRKNASKEVLKALLEESDGRTDAN